MHRYNKRGSVLGSSTPFCVKMEGNYFAVKNLKWKGKVLAGAVGREVE